MRVGAGGTRTPRRADAAGAAAVVHEPAPVVPAAAAPQLPPDAGEQAGADVAPFVPTPSQTPCPLGAAALAASPAPSGATSLHFPPAAATPPTAAPAMAAAAVLSPLPDLDWLLPEEFLLQLSPDEVAQFDALDKACHAAAASSSDDSTTAGAACLPPD